MFSKILIANRGEVAARIARTCERMGVQTVAVYSDADAEGVHVQVCDEAVRIGPPPVRESYLSIDAILAAAKETQAEAVHPGYGLLSESPVFARAVREAGLTFIGPSADAMETFGDKLRSRELAVKAGVRVIPGSDGPVEVETARQQAAQIGFPLLVKAAGGGGGIGMQIVEEEAALEKALERCADRGRAAFGNDRVYLERLLHKPRHVEVQLLADAHGSCVSLGERECSIQRRHQKILEECPAPALGSWADSNPKRDALCDAAVRIAQEIGYENAGTCEFLFDDAGGFYFLEFNPRLQVEHAVTEMCTNLDIVELQLRIACGEHLPKEARHPALSGHSIEARIYAENPAKGFLPSPGEAKEIRWPTVAPGKLRVESGIAAGAKVTPYYDPMIAKIITYGSTRHEALLTLDRVLAETVISPLTTNLDFLRTVLANEAFRAGQYDTTSVEELVKRQKAQKPKK